MKFYVNQVAWIFQESCLQYILTYFTESLNKNQNKNFVKKYLLHFGGLDVTNVHEYLRKTQFQKLVNTSVKKSENEACLQILKVRLLSSYFSSKGQKDICFL